MSRDQTAALDEAMRLPRRAMAVKVAERLRRQATHPQEPGVQPKFATWPAPAQPGGGVKEACDAGPIPWRSIQSLELAIAGLVGDSTKVPFAELLTSLFGVEAHAVPRSFAVQVGICMSRLRFRRKRFRRENGSTYVYVRHNVRHAPAGVMGGETSKTPQQPVAN